MSGFSDETVCPNCGQPCSRYSDYKPFDMVWLDCANCGFYTDTRIKQLSLEELNDVRVSQDLEKLEELPAWELDDSGYRKVTTKEKNDGA